MLNLSSLFPHYLHISFRKLAGSLMGSRNMSQSKGVDVGIARGDGQQSLIISTRRRSNAGGQGVFKFYDCIPMGAKLPLGWSECLLRDKCGVELHG